MNNTTCLSSLSKTWIFDLDGTLVEHNGYKFGNEKILVGVIDFFCKNIKPTDFVIITTGRTQEQATEAISLLRKENIKIDLIIPNLPIGERLLFNDIKPQTNLKTAFSFNLERNAGLQEIHFFYEGE